MKKLQKNSNAQLVICRLVDLGGKAKISQLICVLSPECQRLHKVQTSVLDVLTSLGYVTVDCDRLTATQRGKDYAGQFYARHLPVCEKYVGQVATPRVMPEHRPLKIGNILKPLVQREGAFDYRNIPSKMGSQRILPSGEVVE